MAEADIKVLILENPHGDVQAIRRSLENYRQVAFEIVTARDVPEALRAISDRHIEFAVLDASGPLSLGAGVFRELMAAKFPLPIVAVGVTDSQNLVEQGAADALPWSELGGTRLPRALVRLWIRAKTQAHQKGTGPKDSTAPQVRQFIEEQTSVLKRLQRVDALLASLVPENHRTYDLLSEDEQLEIRLQLVDLYIEITKIYFLREDERSEELIWKLCNHLVALRFPPKELTPVHLGAVELMLTEPSQSHRQGLIAENRLVFIDILLNLLGHYFSLLQQAEARSGGPQHPSP
ncbi:MAG: hypothetical protein HYU36_20235 [Planctomycetes bacterium]|nr:hypothetical protein [Planctomycetota bacterium]